MTTTDALAEGTSHEVFQDGIRLFFKSHKNQVHVYNSDQERISVIFRNISEDEARMYHNGYAVGIARGWMEGRADAKKRIAKILEL